jgi:Domain of unknown function (DUF1707)
MTEKPTILTVRCSDAQRRQASDRIVAAYHRGMMTAEEMHIRLDHVGSTEELSTLRRLVADIPDIARVSGEERRHRRKAACLWGALGAETGLTAAVLTIATVHNAWAAPAPIDWIGVVLVGLWVLMFCVMIITQTEIDSATRQALQARRQRRHNERQITRL